MAGDIVDQATSNVEKEMAYLLKAHGERAKKAKRMPKICLNCEEPLDVGRFCDGDCQHDYEKRVRAKRLTYGIST